MTGKSRAARPPCSCRTTMWATNVADDLPPICHKCERLLPTLTRAHRFTGTGWPS